MQRSSTRSVLLIAPATAKRTNRQRSSQPEILKSVVFEFKSHMHQAKAFSLCPRHFLNKLTNSSKPELKTISGEEYIVCKNYYSLLIS